MPSRFPKGDYSHLRERTPAEILERSIFARGYGGAFATYEVSVNETLIGMFEGRDRIGAADLLGMQAAFVERAGRGSSWTPEFWADFAGNLIGWGLHLALLVEAPGPDGERGWRMPDREMQFDVHRNRTRRIRGLPGEEQAAMNRRLLTQARRAATLDRQRAESLAPLIATALSEILALEPEATVPATWGRYVGEDVPARWPLMREAFGLLVEAHREWPRRRQQNWLDVIRRELALAHSRGWLRKRAEAEAEEAAAAVRLAEDADAFEGL